MVLNHANARAGGTEIRLEMEPVDPRDLLLGHYVELVTPLQRLDTSEFGDAGGHVFQRGDRIWVGLGNRQRRILASSVAAPFTTRRNVCGRPRALCQQCG